MASLRDVPVVWKKVGVWTFLKRVYNEVNEDNLLVWASALAYSWLFAVFPFMLVLIALVPYLPDEWKDQARSQIRVAIYEQMPREAAEQIWQNVEPRLTEVMEHAPRGIQAFFSVGIFVMLWAASGGVNMTMCAIDKCYEVTRARPFYKQRPLALGLTLAFVVLILLVMVLIPVGTVVIRWMVRQAQVAEFIPLVVLVQVVRWALAASLLLTMLALAYYYGPNVRQKWRWITPGSVFTLVVWVALGLGFRFYVDNFGKYSATYGTVGGVAILLLLFYIDAVVILVGAEINSEIDKCLNQLPPEMNGNGDAPAPEAPDSQAQRSGAESAGTAGPADAPSGA